MIRTRKPPYGRRLRSLSDEFYGRKLKSTCRDLNSVHFRHSIRRMDANLFLLVLFSITCHTTEGVKFPNDIEGQPQIECGDFSVRISVKTTNGVASRLYAKNHYSDLSCAFEKTNSGTFNIGTCGMNRQRQLDPRGLSYNLVVVVQLHPMFVTKVDRAYSIKCFYMEAEKTVTSFLDVSMISTQTLTGGPPMPSCNYELHAESSNGPSVRYARVGDKVWHTWSCPSSSYGMLVHSCVVTDGQGNDFKVIDQRGCSIDQYVIRTPEYSSDMTRVQQETNVFKFADKTFVMFNCQIRLCQKTENGCDGISPPDCSDQPIAKGSSHTPKSGFRPAELTYATFPPTPTPLFDSDLTTSIPQKSASTPSETDRNSSAIQINRVDRPSGRSTANKSQEDPDYENSISFILAPSTPTTFPRSQSPGNYDGFLRNDSFGSGLRLLTDAHSNGSAEVTASTHPTSTAEITTPTSTSTSTPTPTSTSTTSTTSTSTPTSKSTSSSISTTSSPTESPETSELSSEVTRTQNTPQNGVLGYSKSGHQNLSATHETSDVVTEILSEEVNDEPDLFNRTFSNSTSQPLTLENATIIIVNDGRGGRNVLGPLVAKAMDATQELIKREEDGNDHGSVNKRMSDQAYEHLPNLETDVSQAMWVLEPEDDGSGKKHSSGGQRSSETIRTWNQNGNDWNDERSAGQICLSTKTALAILTPLLVITFITILAIIICLRRLGLQTKRVHYRQSFPLSYLHRRA